jgi:ribonuclease BN (tRNA processing enzyme)
MHDGLHPTPLTIRDHRIAKTHQETWSHSNVLAAAGLIERVKSGRVVAVHLSPGPLREATSWLQHYERFWSGSLDKLTRYLEEDVR